MEARTATGGTERRVVRESHGAWYRLISLNIGWYRLSEGYFFRAKPTGCRFLPVCNGLAAMGPSQEDWTDTAAPCPYQDRGVRRRSLSVPLESGDTRGAVLAAQVVGLSRRAKTADENWPGFRHFSRYSGFPAKLPSSNVPDRGRQASDGGRKFGIVRQSSLKKARKFAIARIRSICEG